MNVTRLVPNTQAPRASTSGRDRVPQRSAHRERDFGIGYGSSSGYGQERRYAESWAKSMFRCG